MHLLVTAVLPIERIVSKDAFDVSLLANHYVNIAPITRLDRVFDPVDELFLGRFRGIERQISAVDVASDILKAEFNEHGLEIFHLHQIRSADIDSAKQRYISHGI